MRRFLAFLILSLSLWPLCALAHGGRTDSIGGHYDNSTGIYHFHHTFPAHHHPNGVCPYDSSRIYPTDKPPRASQTVRPSSSSNDSSSISRIYSFATIKPTVTPSPGAATSRGKNELPGLIFVLSGTAGLFALTARLASHKPRSARKPTTKTIMTAQPGDTFRMDHPVVTSAVPVASAPPSPKPQPAPVSVTSADPMLSSVSILSGYHLRVDFSNGDTRYFDAIFILLEERYSPLADYDLFRDFHISSSHLLLYWDHFSITISAKRLYMESQSTPTVTVTDKTYPDYSGLKVCFRDMRR